MSDTEKCVSRIRRELHLAYHGKKFEYFDSVSGQEIKFDWDGAGIANKSIVLIELELGGISEWHIQTHLSRLAIMIDQGTSIEKLVWIVDRGAFLTLKNAVDAWLTFFVPICKVKLPNMEYRTPNGELLWA